MDKQHRTLLTEINQHLRLEMHVTTSDHRYLIQAQHRAENYINYRWLNNAPFDETSKIAWQNSYLDIATYATKPKDQGQ